MDGGRKDDSKEKLMDKDPILRWEKKSLTYRIWKISRRERASKYLNSPYFEQSKGKKRAQLCMSNLKQSLLELGTD